MPVANTFNYCKMIMRTTHATPRTLPVRAQPGIYNSQQKFPVVADVRTGTVYGPGQYDQVEYLTGTMVAGGGSAAFRVIGSAVIRRMSK